MGDLEKSRPKTSLEVKEKISESIKRMWEENDCRLSLEGLEKGRLVAQKRKYQRLQTIEGFELLFSFEDYQKPHKRHTKMPLKCLKCGSIDQYDVDDHPLRIVCRYCKILKRSEGYQPLFALNEYKGYEAKHQFKCLKCGKVVESTIHQKPRCYKCHPWKRPSLYSQPHRFCYEYLKKIHSDIEVHKYINEYCVDLFIPSKNLIIEIYGDYWHGNPRFYKATDFIKKGNKKILAQQKWKEDKQREEHLKSLGYEFVSLWEYDIKNSESYKNI